MSLQQVNLYGDELKAKKLNYSALMLAQLMTIFIVVFLVTAGYQNYQLQQQQSILILKQQKQKMAQSKLHKLQAELALRKKDKKLSKLILAKTSELAKKKKVFGILSQDDFGSTKGFAEHVSGLARQRIDGLWLTKIRIAEGGTNVELHGTTSKAELLPKYLQRLSEEKVFAGTKFQNLLISRQEKNKQWLDFSLQNKKIDVVRR